MRIPILINLSLNLSRCVEIAQKIKTFEYFKA